MCVVAVVVVVVIVVVAVDVVIVGVVVVVVDAVVGVVVVDVDVVVVVVVVVFVVEVEVVVGRVVSMVVQNVLSSEEKRKLPFRIDPTPVIPCTEDEVEPVEEVVFVGSAPSG